MARSRREKRAFYTLGHIVIGFLICWIPFYLFIMVRNTFGNHSTNYFTKLNFIMLQRLMRICPITCQNGMDISKNYCYNKVKFLLFVFFENYRFFNYSFWMSYINSSINPIIYGIGNDDFRRAFKKVVTLKYFRNS